MLDIIMNNDIIKHMMIIKLGEKCEALSDLGYDTLSAIDTASLRRCVGRWCNIDPNDIEVDIDRHHSGAAIGIRIMGGCSASPADAAEAVEVWLAEQTPESCRSDDDDWCGWEWQ